MHLVLQEELRQEHGERVSAQALVEQHKQQLADLKLEASVLRQASAEHARSHQLPSCHLMHLAVLRIRIKAIWAFYSRVQMRQQDAAWHRLHLL